MLTFSDEKLFFIIDILSSELKELKPKEILEFEVLNPDILTSSYSGKKVLIEQKEYIYRGYKSWIDLAEILYCKMLTPQIVSKNFVKISFEKLDLDDSFHKIKELEDEKYGVDSIFSQINKNEEPAFLYYYKQALKNVKIDKRVRVLNLGINSGDEFEAIKDYSLEFEKKELVGIDYCKSAIASAKEKFDDKNITFINADINKLDSLSLEKFDLIISIGTLQSSNLDFNAIFMSLVQNYLTKEGAIILGFPNCRWIDGEMIYGAKMRNYSYPEMSNLYKDVNFCKKYLQQKKFRVTITGKNYIFLTATSFKKEV